jgi:hypothetical protein
VAAEYRIDLHDVTGAKVAEVTDYLELTYSQRVCEPGFLQFVIPGASPSVDGLVFDGVAVVFKRESAIGLPWTEQFASLVRKVRKEDHGRSLVTVSCPGVMSLLARRHVAYRAGTANRSDFVAQKVELVMKYLVIYNATASALASAGRILDGAFTGITIGIAGATNPAEMLGGATISAPDLAYSNLLSTLQDVATGTGSDFDFVRTGASTYEFRFYPGQMGTDRRASVLFSLERGNMADPVYEIDRIEEKTVAIVGGQGDGSTRVTRVVQGPDYPVGRDAETFVDGRSAKTTSALDLAGQTELRESRAKIGFGFRVLQTPGCAYGVHYFLGDLVTANYDGLDISQKVVGATINLSEDSAELIEIEMETPYA